MVEIYIGENKQKFSLLLDTSTPIVWIVSKDCEDKDCELKKRFDSSKSATFVLTGQTVSFKYIDDSQMRGWLAKDQVHFSELDESLVTKGVSLVEVYELDEPNKLDPYKKYDGVLGMTQDMDILKQMKQNGAMDREMFSICYDHGQTLTDIEESQQVGEMILGSYIDSSKFFGPLNWISITSDQHWDIRIDSVYLAGGVGYEYQELADHLLTLPEDELLKQIHGSPVCEFGCEATLNTALNEIAAPLNEAQAINNVLGGQMQRQGLFVIDNCHEKESRMPHLVFKIGGNEFRLRPEQYLRPLLPPEADDKRCVSGIRVSPSSRNRWQLGNLFISNHYVAFDAETKRVGLAKLKEQAAELKPFFTLQLIQAVQDSLT